MKNIFPKVYLIISSNRFWFEPDLRNRIISAITAFLVIKLVNDANYTIFVITIRHDKQITIKAEAIVTLRFIAIFCERR